MGHRILVALAAALLATACDGGEREEQRITLGEARPRGTAMLPSGVQAQVDSGNAAYRARDYREALRHFQAAAELAPNEATTWFGVAMAAGALGETQIQREAQAKVQQLAPQADMGAAHPAVEGGMPPGHPPAERALPPGHPEVEAELPEGHPPIRADTAG